jgi:Zn-dependent peptidase ImmA (M78 family)/transcriptional regulator with XRE-family HTH domain
VPKSVPALVTPALLVWTRENAGYTQDEFAERFKKPLEVIAAWESGDAQPTVAQARTWAKVCGRPLAVLYLSEPPYDFAPLEDYRRVDVTAEGEATSWLRRAIRLARDRRQLVLDLLADDEDVEVRPWGLAIPRDDAEAAGEWIREFLGADLQNQRRHGRGHAPWNYWKHLAESAGALVFQMERVKVDEARGLSMFHSELPVVVVNPGDSPKGRVFTLLHEVGHLGLRSSGLCDRGEDVAEEAYCNAVAAAALMPREAFLGQIIGMRGEQHWSEQRISELADKFGASREASVRRLSTVGYVSEGFYLAKRAEYRAEHQRQQRAKEGKEVKLRREVVSLASNGPVLVEAAFRAFWDGRIGIGDLAAMTDVKVGSVGKLREELLRRV